jgi:hypothetical protein
MWNVYFVFEQFFTSFINQTLISSILNLFCGMHSEKYWFSSMCLEIQNCATDGIFIIIIIYVVWVHKQSYQSESHQEENVIYITKCIYIHIHIHMYTTSRCQTLVRLRKNKNTSLYNLCVCALWCCSYIWARLPNLVKHSSGFRPSCSEPRRFWGRTGGSEPRRFWVRPSCTAPIPPP